MNNQLGIIGMGVMGKALALNAANKGIDVAVYNRQLSEKDASIASSFAIKEGRNNLKGYDDLPEFLSSLQSPRVILLMIKAGSPVDEMIDLMLPHLNSGDVLIDGGNSHYLDTERRIEKLEIEGIYYIGMGISGGEEGALKGPSMMPGGSERGFVLAQPMLNKMAAEDKNGNPCIAYLEGGGVGHFIKMVHNGIEYGEMQLLAELYLVCKHQYGLSNEEIIQVLEAGYKSQLSSFLLSVTIDILGYKEDENSFLLDRILDQSGQKGTGRWTVESALTLGSPVSTISEALFARFISADKEVRSHLAGVYKKTIDRGSINDEIRSRLLDAYQAARIINHLTGFDMMKRGAGEYMWDLDLSEVARIWTSGCIIRSELMDELVDVFKDEDIINWSHPTIKGKLKDSVGSLKAICSEGIVNGIPLPVFSSAINHFNGLTMENSGANLIQAQRDYFGAHTYQRIDKTGFFHSQWK